MPVSKKKKSSAKQKSRKKSTGRAGTSRSRKAGSSSSSSRMLQAVGIICFWALGLITMFRLGAAGKVLYGTLSLFFGSFTLLLIAGGMVFTFMYIYNGGRSETGFRTYAGLAFFGAAWTMISGLLSISPADPLGLWNSLLAGWKEVISGSIFSWYGFIGAGLSGLFTLLFSRAGAWIFAIAFLFIGALLAGWDVWRQYWIDYRSRAPRTRISLREKYMAKRAEADAASRTDSAEPEGKHPGKIMRFIRSVFEEQEDELPDMEEQDIPVLHWTDMEPESLLAGIRTDSPEGNERKKSSLLERMFLDPLPDTKESRQPEKAAAEAAAQSIPSDEAIQTDDQPDLMQAAENGAAVRRKTASLNIPAFARKETKAEKTDKEPVSSPAATAVSRSRPRPSDQEDTPAPVTRLPQASSTDLSRYTMPKISLLNDPPRIPANNANTVQAREDGHKLIAILQEFGVKAELTDIHIGPSVTKFEIAPGQGVRVNSITNLQNDIKMALAATDIRIEAPIPGKSAVGIEVPNVEKTEVGMRDLLRTLPRKYATQPLVFTLGKDLMGENVYGRLDTMPHLLIAGATGSGKSVCVNSIISSILMRTRPDEVKLILIDPKKVEFTPYNGVPHLLAPVITDGDLANKALQVVVAMMDRRYDLFEETMVRNITAYNAYVDQHPDSHYQKLPRIVVIIDELADLMLAAAKEVEQSIQRITQLARAAGIHLIVATQRPSVNVITGVIKANIPSRIAFAVSSSVDSRTILDQAGAERLLGYGDMLFLDNGDTAPRRIQGVFIKDEEVMRIAEYVKSQAAPAYDDAFITLKDLQSQGGTAAPQDLDPLYEEVKHFVITSRKASTSLIQRRFSLGYARAARLIDSLEFNGIVGPANGSKPREILAPAREPDDLDL